MTAPYQQPITLRDVTITCFTCAKDMILQLKTAHRDKKIICPVCGGKEAIISSPNKNLLSQFVKYSVR